MLDGTWWNDNAISLGLVAHDRDHASNAVARITRVLQRFYKSKAGDRAERTSPVFQASEAGPSLLFALLLSAQKVEPREI